MRTNNYKNHLLHLIGAGELQVVGIDGNKYTVGSNGTTPKAKFCENLAFNYIRKDYISNGEGVAFGTGDDAETEDSYQLSGADVTSQLTIQGVLDAKVEGNTAVRSASFTLTNNTTAPITIREVGYITAISGGTTMMLLDRTVLETPLVLEAGAIGQLHYEISMEV